ncbi:PIN domain-containing protein [Desulfocicer niacini]
MLIISTFSGKNTTTEPMKKNFFEYNPLGLDDISTLWNQAIFVFDTNVLLNLYRYSRETSNKFVQIISDLSDRIWIPYQVGFEFNENRLVAITDQIDSYSTFEKKLNELSSEIENKNRNPFFTSDLTDKFISLKSEFTTEIESKSEEYRQSLLHDKLLETINEIFNGKVGSYYEVSELSKIYEEGEKRYKKKIPPGYCDAHKPDQQKYGDFIIWKQILEKSKSSDVDIIFVLDDNKKDWWLTHKGKTISPRPELLKEFRQATSRNIHFYKPFQFLQYSNDFLNSSVNLETIEEVKSYKKSIIQSTNATQIKFILKGTVGNIQLLLDDLKSSGYSCYNKETGDEHHCIFVYLSNIPDLERRLKEKYIKRLTDYSLVLLDIETVH